jgi:hypothetical protein
MLITWLSQAVAEADQAMAQAAVQVGFAVVLQQQAVEDH